MYHDYYVQMSMEKKELFKNDIIVPIIIFLFSFFVILTISVPALQVNDGWITANQLHQLFNGHQILFNEGKYGYYFGQISEYFSYRNNILGYSLILPIISLPFQFFLTTLEDNFRLMIIFIWSIIPLIIITIIKNYWPENCQILKIPLIFPTFIFSITMMAINLFFYYPFPADIFHDPIESGSLILTMNFIFAIECVLLYIIGNEIFHNKEKAIFTSISIISCSSYIFWATDAKDHLLTVFLITCSLLFFIRYITHKSARSIIMSFFLLGILTWARPELGISIFLSLTCFFFLYILLKNKKNSIMKIHFLSIFAFPIGLIPFFLNNYILTKNPFYPPFLEYKTDFMPKVATEITNLNSTGAILEQEMIPFSDFSVCQIGTLMMNFYSFKSPSLLEDIKGILFFPQNDSMSLVALTPLLIIAIISSFYFFLSRKEINSDEKWIIIICLFLIFGILLAYIRSIHVLHTSEGIAPDIRYLSPFYVPGGIIGLIFMKNWRFSPITSKTWKYSLLGIFLGAPLLIILFLFLQPFGGGFPNFTYTFSLCSYGLLMIFIFQYLISELIGRHSKILLTSNLILLLIVPVSWQLMLVFLFSFAKFDGYSYWIPISEQIFLNFFIPVS